MMVIIPYQSVGIFCFGQTRAHIRTLLGSQAFAFRKHAAQSEIEVAPDLGLHFHFNPRELLEFIEAFQPAEVTLKGVMLLRRQFTDVRRNLAEFGFESADDEPERFDTAGLSLTVLDGMVDAVGAFVQGYYDD